MGNFIGGIGAAFIMAAALAVIAKFFCEAGLIKDKQAIRQCGEVSLVTVIIGGVYLFLTAFVVNSIKQRTNFFDFEKLFAFCNVGDVLTVCRNFDIKGAFGGLMMPLYPLAVSLTGKLVFEQYVQIAELVSFVSACVSANVLYGMLKNKAGVQKTVNLMLILSSLPYVFVLFAPTYLSLTLAFVMCSVYALSKSSNKGFVILAILACLTSKLGIIAFLLYPFYKKGMISALTRRMVNSAAVSNEIVNKIVVASLVFINGIILFCQIRGL